MIKLKLDLSVIGVPIITLLFCYSPLGGVVGCASDKEFFVKLQFCQLLEADPAPGPRPIWASWWALRITRKKTSQGDRTFHFNMSKEQLCAFATRLTLWWEIQAHKNKSKVQTRNLDTKGTSWITWMTNPTKHNFLLCGNFAWIWFHPLLSSNRTISSTIVAFLWDEQPHHSQFKN